MHTSRQRTGERKTTGQVLLKKNRFRPQSNAKNTINSVLIIKSSKQKADFVIRNTSLNAVSICSPCTAVGTLKKFE